MSHSQAHHLTYTRPTVSYRANSENNTAQSTYTFTSMDIGTAAGNRHVVVGVYLRSGTPTISSVTVAGISATLLTSQATAVGIVGLYIAAVPTGTTGNVVVTLSAAGVRAKAATWAVYGLAQNGAASNTATSTASPLSLSLTTSVGAVMIAAGFNSGGDSTFTWSGLTEDFDTPISGGPNGATGASALSTVNGSVTISATISASSSPCGVSASLR